MLLFPPGAASGRYFRHLIAHIPKNTKIYAFDYPARGYTPPSGDNTVKGIATEISKFIKRLELNNFSILGVSYGTTIATEIAQSKEFEIDTVYLIAPGEYIPLIYHPFIYILFFPTMFSENIRKFYRNILLNLGIFDTFPKKNLKDILFQWFGILQYSLNDRIEVDINCRILLYSADEIIRKNSLKKISKIYPNNSVISKINNYNRHLSEDSYDLLSEFLDNNK